MQYESPTFSGLKVMAKVKVLVHAANADADCRAMTSSPDIRPGSLKRRQILDFRMEPKKKKNFFLYAFRSLSCIGFVAVAFQSEGEVLWRRDPSLTIDLFLPHPGSTPGWSLPKSLNTGAGP